MNLVKRVKEQLFPGIEEEIKIRENTVFRAVYAAEADGVYQTYCPGIKNYSIIMYTMF